MSDPVSRFFQRQGNSAFATDYRLSALMLVLPLVLALYVDTYFSNVWLFTLIYAVLALASLILQKNGFQLRYAQYRKTLIFLIVANFLIWVAIVINVPLDIDDEIYEVICAVILLLAFVVKSIGVNLSFSSQYEEK